MRLASRGLRNMDGGDEQVKDDTEARALRKQARTVYLQAAATAAALTALVAIIPR